MGPPKLRNRVFLGKCSKWNLNFQNWNDGLFCDDARSVVISDLRSETKGRFPVRFRLPAMCRGEGGSGREELNRYPPPSPAVSRESWMFLKENPDSKKKHRFWVSLSQQNGWLLWVHHTFCVTEKVNRHLSKKMKKNICVQEI